MRVVKSSVRAEATGPGSGSCIISVVIVLSSRPGKPARPGKPVTACTPGTKGRPIRYRVRTPARAQASSRHCFQCCDCLTRDCGAAYICPLCRPELWRTIDQSRSHSGGQGRQNTEPPGPGRRLSRARQVDGRTGRRGQRLPRRLESLMRGKLSVSICGRPPAARAQASSRHCFH